MVNAISGGPAPVGLEATPRPHDLPDGGHVARQAAVAAAAGAAALADPKLAQQSPAYGVATNAQTHESNTRHDAKKKLADHERGAAPKHEGRGDHVDVEA
ncbi:MAG: hypothetical protein H6922_03140 [Pseudomonadaceae bacterium]|nr:hypothetical protein [Pseudomonadaceae bacterium]